MNSANTFPLFRGSTTRVFEPSIQDFIERVKENKSFTFVREQSEWWHLIYEGLKTCAHGVEIQKYNFKDKHFLDTLTHAFIKQQPRIGGDRGWPPHTYEVWRGCVEIMTAPKPLGFHFGVSQGHICHANITTDQDVPPPLSYTHLRPRRPQAHEVDLIIQSLFPKDERLWRATVWRKWGATSEIHRFFEEFKKDHIVLVGRKAYSNFGQKLQLPNYHFLETHGTNASPDLDKIQTSIVNLHNSTIKSDSERIIYLMAAGDTTRYIQWRLHDTLRGNVSMIDVGRALDPYYRHDRVFRNNSGAWGHWHHYPAWVPNVCPYVIQK